MRAERSDLRMWTLVGKAAWLMWFDNGDGVVVSVRVPGRAGAVAPAPAPAAASPAAAAAQPAGKLRRRVVALPAALTGRDHHQRRGDPARVPRVLPGGDNTEKEHNSTSADGVVVL